MSCGRATRLLLSEDDPHLRKILCALPRQEGFHVSTAVDGIEALERLQHGDEYDAVVLDHEMPHLKGLELLSLLRSQGRRLPVVICSGTLLLTEEECARFDIGPVVSKPCEISVLVNAIHNATRDGT